MNVDEDRIHPWLSEEKKYLERAIAAGGHILGICLGAQLLARVLGASVTRNAHKEIGWHTLRLRPDAARDPFFPAYPPAFPAFEWHQDTFTIPAGCRRLAESDACANQAFSYEGRVLGVQFHLEADGRVVRTLVDACPEDLAAAGPYVQSAQEMMAAHVASAQAERLSQSLLDKAIAACAASG
jgi:GMP synthase-like glutamine amidotransferase